MAASRDLSVVWDKSYVPRFIPVMTLNLAALRQAKQLQHPHASPGIKIFST